MNLQREVAYMENAENQFLTREQIMLLSPLALIDWLHDQFGNEVPRRVETPEDMMIASEQLLCLTSQYSFLCELLSYAKIIVREAKRNLPKEDYEDMIDKQNAIDRRLDIVKQQYTAISRAVTIKTETNKEMSMGERYIPQQEMNYYDR